MMSSVIHVADDMLKIAKLKGVSLTPLQLMKLVYIAHGWHLAIKSSDLFPERIEAWKFGPVVPDLYHATKHYGRDPIALEDIKDGPPSLDGETVEFLKDVFDKYGHLSGFALSSLTHKAGTPWDMVYRDGVFDIEISDDLIRDHYSKLLHEYENTSSAATRQR